MDTGGILYILDTVNFRVLSVVNGLMYQTHALDGFRISGLTSNNNGSLFVTTASQVLMLSASNPGSVSAAATTIAGTLSPGFSGDGGPAASAMFNFPVISVGLSAGGGLAVDSGGSLYLADGGNFRIRKVTFGPGSPQVTTIAGNGKFKYGGDGGPATAAFLNYPTGLAFDTSGNLFVAEQMGNKIRKIDSSGIIGTLVGNGIPLNTGDSGPVSSAQIAGPTNLAVDSAGNLYVECRPPSLAVPLRHVDPKGTITSINSPGFTPTFPAFVKQPAVDPSGNLYGIVSGFDVNNIPFTKVFQVAVPSGTLTPVAGNGQVGFSGDGGLATNALLYPANLAFDSAGNLFISDNLARRIRKVNSAGMISTFAGNGLPATMGDGGLALNAALTPGPLAFDSAGNLYTSTGSVIRKITSSGLINTVFALPAGLTFPYGMVLDKVGRIYLTFANDTIGRVDAIPPVLTSVAPPSVLPGSQAITLTVNGSGFDVDSVIRWNGGSRATTYKGYSQLQVAINESDIATPGSADISVFNPGLGGAASNSLAFGFALTPTFTPQSVVSAASFQPGASPGSIVSIFGSNLANGTGSASTLPLPTSLAGAKLTLNGTPMPLFYVSPTQINAQIPFGALSPGTLKIQNHGAGSQDLTIVAASPGIFTAGGAQGAILNADYSLADAVHPAPAGSTVLIFCTGLGAVLPLVAEGVAAPSNPPATTTAFPQVFVNTNTLVPVSFSGLSPGFVGLYQVNFQLPAVVPNGPIKVRLSMGGVASNEVTIVTRAVP
jgi:uncharacterized protein (TIGR03437 family)